ncbi:molybdate ABC transporter substrate-binding protein [Deinococcus radiophilus]|uniref:molybdate ABC transporter substrate-binding protein n=1 Tax=Deinococcus radiophilus TaxID=32062 RepID=UPI00361DA4E3
MQTERATSAARLTLAAPSSLKEVANDLAEQYTKQHPEVAVQVTTGASGTLLQQLRQGAPIDVLLSADTKTMTQAQEADLLAGSPQTLAYNSLVLIAPAAATAPGGTIFPPRWNGWPSSRVWRWVSLTAFLLAVTHRPH